MYLEEWDRLLPPYQNLPIRLLEIGVQNGGSLEIWSKYFSEAEKIIGCDINQDCKDIKFEDARVTVVVGDANSDECERQILQQATAFDVIIDDGSHKSSDIVRSFVRYFAHLNEGGIYLVEDLHCSYWKDFEGGLHNPFSAMAFFKRLADVLNYEHWRNNQSRASFLTEFAGNFGIRFDEIDLTRIHSIEFLNSLCVIKKAPPDKNALGRRVVTGMDEQITKGAKRLDGTVIQDFTAIIEEDAHLDVFELIKSVQALQEESSKLDRQTRAQLAEQEQALQALQAKLDEREQQASIINTQKTRLEQELTNLNDHLNQRERILQDLNSELLEIYGSTAWKLIQGMWKARLRLAPKGSWRERFVHSLFGLLKKNRRHAGNGHAQSEASKSINPDPVYNDLFSVARGERGSEYVDISETDLSKNSPLVKLIAFYLPQYHPFPENDEWWGKGFTEWTNVSKAVPQFLGHYQPHLPGELGFYDLRLPEVQRRQVELAKKYGVYGFCFYYYWFNGKRLLERPLDQFVSDPEIDFPFCLCWANENWTRRWDGRSDEILMSQEHSFEIDKEIIRDFVKYFSNPRYIHIDNRPLLIVYRADILVETKAVLDYWRKYSIEHGTGLPYILVAQTFGYMDPSADGFDGAVQFPPHNGEAIPEISEELTLLNGEFKGRIYRYSDFVGSSINRLRIEPFRQFNTIFPGWDNESRRPGNGMIYAGSSPELYAKWLEAVCHFALINNPQEERYVFINAWNEWGEGAHLEPDRRFGYAYLQATSDVLKKVNNGESSLHLQRIQFSQQNTPINEYIRKYNNIIQSWPYYSTLRADVSIQDKTNSSQHLISAIDNFLSTKVIGKSAIPLVSIIIPVFNHFEDTLNCIKSFRDTHEKCSYEIIVIDDCSTDETHEVLSNCKTIRYFRNEENSGFLNSCNNASQYALGKYIVLLNNDTLVLPGWLDSLVDTYNEYPDAGLVGSKLIYPNGRLQESGGVIWEDASGINYGRDDDPDKPQYNFLREVDYCSGACLCIPKSIWEELQGFDPLFTPAYYEDTDLAFRIRQKGYRVLYQPLSQVIHVEGATSGTDIAKGTKHYQEINRQKFYDRWKEVLSSHGDNSQPEMIYRNRSRRSHALVIDVCTPKPDHDSGSIDTYYYLLMLRKIGFEVTFISVVDSEVVDNYVVDLQKKGIECIYKPYLVSIDDYLMQSGKYFDAVLLFRAPYGGKYINSVRKYAPQAKVVFNTVDLHFLRENRESKVTGIGLKSSLRQEAITKNNEILIMKKADQTIIVSDHERDLLRSLGDKIKSRVIPLPRAIPGREKGFDGRKNIVFIGGYLHKPNVDAVLYFAQEIWPLISQELPDCEFWVVGSNIPKEVEDLQGKNIRIVGYVADLAQVFSECKMSVAPLRYGAGIKGKIITSLTFGVPCVATSVASEGMGLTHEQNILIGDSPQEFSKLVVELYNNKETWEELSLNGLSIVRQKYSLENFENNLINLVNDLGIKSIISEEDRYSREGQ